MEGNEVGGNAKVKAKAKAMAKADAAQQDVNKNHRLALRGNEAGNELQQRQEKWKNQAMENYQLTQQICH